MAGNDTRNIALVGHGRSGKTTLGEAALFAAKAVSRQGTIGDKNTVSDFADHERERRIDHGAKGAWSAMVVRFPTYTRRRNSPLRAS